MKHMLMGVAALALAAASAQADPGKGKDNGGGAKPQQAQTMKGNGGGKPDRGPAMKADRGPAMKQDRGPAMQAAKGDDRGPAMKAADRGPAMKAAKAEDRGPSMKAAKADDRGPGMKPQKADRGPDMKPGKSDDRGRDMVRVDRDDRGPDRVVGNIREDSPRRGIRIASDGRRIYESRDARDWWGDNDQRGLIAGCPPGLAKKNNGCMPPGQLKDRDDDRYRFATYRPDWWGLTSLGLGGGNYFYRDGYLLRYDGDRVAGYVPLLGGALAIGNPWPSYYAPRPVPQYLVDYYGLGPQGSYRYADDVLYRVDPETAAITSIAALLTGDDIEIGSPMPLGYDVYNVPYPYRSQYVDGPGVQYRYSDGYVYQVDPETRLVAAAIELLAT